MRSRLFHAVCPVQHFDASKWAGWLIRSTERITAPAGVTAHAADSRILKSYPARSVSSGEGWLVHHLVKDGGSR